SGGGGGMWAGNRGGERGGGNPVTASSTAAPIVRIEISDVCIRPSVSGRFLSWDMRHFDQGDRMARLPPRRPVIDALGRHDLDPEAREPDIGEPGRGQQADRGDAQILENLGAKPDLAPLPRARDLGAGRARLRDGMR